MPWIYPGNAAIGELSAAILAGDTSLVLAGGEGNARFPAMNAGDFFYAAIFDQSLTSTFDKAEIIKITARATDTLTISRAQNGTVAKAFPISGGSGLVADVKISAADAVLNLIAMAHGGGAIIQAAAPALTAESADPLILTPVAPITVTLPTTRVFAGQRFTVCNLAAAGANVITVQASGGATVCVVPAGTNVILQAVQDTPTLPAHWFAEMGFLGDPTRLGQGGSAAWMKMMGAVDVNTAQVSGTGVLISYAVPANTLNGAGSLLSIFGISSQQNGQHFVFGASDIQAGIGLAGVKAITNAFVVNTGVASQKIGTMTRGSRDDQGVAAYANYVLGSDAMSAIETMEFKSTGGTEIQEIMLTSLAP